MKALLGLCFYLPFKKNFFPPCQTAYGTLVPPPGIKPTTPCLHPCFGSRSLSQWTTREVLPAVHVTRSPVTGS